MDFHTGVADSFKLLQRSRNIKGSRERYLLGQNTPSTGLSRPIIFSASLRSRPHTPNRDHGFSCDRLYTVEFYPACVYYYHYKLCNAFWTLFLPIFKLLSLHHGDPSYSPSEETINRGPPCVSACKKIRYVR